MEEIYELNIWTMDRSKKFYIDDNNKIPDATPENMELLVNKINELVERVNKLSK